MLSHYKRPVDASPSAGQIDACCSAPSLDEIAERLGTDGSNWAIAARERLRAASPTSLQLTHLLLRHGAERAVEECFEAEPRLAVAVTATAEFQEGVRAVLVDKDLAPLWSAGVSATEVEELFDCVVGN